MADEGAEEEHGQEPGARGQGERMGVVVGRGFLDQLVLKPFGIKFLMRKGCGLSGGPAKHPSDAPPMCLVCLLKPLVPPL